MMTTTTAIQVKEVAFTCYPVQDMERARRFYEETFGWAPASVSEGEHGNQWVEYDLGGTYFSLGYMPDSFVPSVTGALAGLEVVNFEASVNALRQREVKFLMEPLETPVCHMCIVEDSEGNSLMMHQLKQGDNA